jgi:type I restriction enzyme S subunit
MVPLGKVGEIGSGITLGRRVRGRRTRRVPYLRVANVKDAHLDLADVYEIEATEEEIEALRLRVGDLLLTEGGDADQLGRGTLWRAELPLCIHQNHIFRVRFDPEQFSSEFIAAEIASPYGKAYFLAHAKQTTGIATINQRVLAAFPLIAPSLAEQQRIASILREQLAAVERGQAAAVAQLSYLKSLPGVLLSRAFRGEL